MSIVAIVGRPNVGKSTLFNKIIGKRKALVTDMAGVTRDRHFERAEWMGCEFTIIDTGGLSFDESDAVESKVHDQSIVALDEATVIVCLFDAVDGLTQLDKEIVETFRKTDKKIIYVVNKIDNIKHEDLIFDFAPLGVDLLPISAEHKLGLGELLDEIIKDMPKKVEFTPECEDSMKIALVGRPNTGKSTIINRLAREDRVVVHDMAGTTRDSIDVEVIHKNRSFIFVDTAGVKKKAKTIHKIDKFSTIKSLNSIDDADIIFVVLDGRDGVTHQDLTMAAYAFGRYKPTAILVNKWDLVEADPEMKKTLTRFLKDISESLKELREIPVVCISGKTGFKCREIFRIAGHFKRVSNERIATGKLNKFLDDLVAHTPPPDYRGKHVKLKYISQVDVKPPVFTIHTNQPKGIKTSYKRYLTKGLRKLLGKAVIPIVVKFKS